MFDNASAPNAPRVTATATIDGMQLAVDQEFKIDTKKQLIVTGPVTGTGGIRMTGTSATSLGDNGRLELRSSSNTFEGGTEITGGMVRFGTSSFPLNTALGTGDILIDGGTFSFTPTFAPANSSGEPQTPGNRSFTNKLKVGAAGGQSHQNIGSGNNTVVAYGDIELGGPLRMTSNGGGNATGYTIDGTITVLQDTTRNTSISSETSHNGDDYISGRIVDGAGTAGNPLRIGTTNRKLNITGLGNTYAGGTILAGSGGNLAVRPCTTLGTGNVTAESGARVSIMNLAPLGTACCLRRI